MLDVRLFLNQTVTISGIPLNLRQWNVLQGVSNNVNRAIEKGKTHVRTSDQGNSSNS